MTDAAAPRFNLLLATYNGEKHLDEQIASLTAQTAARIDVIASDDGSTDGTLAMLSRTAGQWEKGQFEIRTGPRNGFAENFRSLILGAAPDADYYAFCDQDDIWDPDKLDHARARLEQLPSQTPALYCSSTRTISEDGRQISSSPLMRRTPSFRNALVQSIAGGNTMVMNRAALQLMQKASRNVRFVSHDWWCYLVLSGAGGVVIYDPIPRIAYRQHAGNLIGANVGAMARMQRVKFLMDGGWSGWIDTNAAALNAARDVLTEENRQMLDAFVALRRLKNPLHRLRRLQRLGLYRQSTLGSISMFVALFAGKF